MVGLSLVGKSAMADFIRKNEPRGDKIQYEKIWTENEIDDFNLFPDPFLLYIVKGIDIIVEIKNGESAPEISGDDIKLYYPETESGYEVAQKEITIDTSNRGLDALITMCKPESIRRLNLNNISGTLYFFGHIDLNYVILDSSLENIQKQILLQGGANLEISGTPPVGRIIFKAIGWKIIRSEW